MSAEDNLEEVYRDLVRTRSELDTQVIREIMTKKEVEAKAKARKQRYELLHRDLALAKRWLCALGDDTFRMESRLSVAVGEDEHPPKTPLGEENMDKTLETLLADWAKYPGYEKRRHQLEKGLSIEQNIGELVTRTARRLQSDAYRLLNLVAFIAGRSTELKTEHVDWIVPYLEGQLKFLKGKHGYFQEEKVVYADYDLDALASRLAIDRRRSLEARILSDRPQVNFNIPRFQGVEENCQDRCVTPAKVLLEGVTSATNEANDLVSPKTLLVAPDHQASESMSPRMRKAFELDNIQGDCDSLSMEANLSDDLDSKFSSEIQQLAQQVIKSKVKAQARLSKALGIGDSLLKTNASLRLRLQKQSKYLQREAKLREVSEQQISALSNELRGETVLERLYMRGDVVADNIQAEKNFQFKRDLLTRQLREFEEWYRSMKQEEAARGMKPEESRVHDAHDDLMRHFKRNIISLEKEREQEWLEFVGGLDGFSESDIKIWKALRGVTTWSGPVTTTPLKIAEVADEARTGCLYCDEDGCLGCSGYRAEYDRPWLEL